MIILNAHDEEIESVSWSPDGDYIVTSSPDGKISIFKTKSGIRVSSFPGWCNGHHIGQWQIIHLHPDLLFALQWFGSRSWIRPLWGIMYELGYQRSSGNRACCCTDGNRACRKNRNGRDQTFQRRYFWNRAGMVRPVHRKPVRIKVIDKKGPKHPAQKHWQVSPWIVTEVLKSDRLR